MGGGGGGGGEDKLELTIVTVWLHLEYQKAILIQGCRNHITRVASSPLGLK